MATSPHPERVFLSGRRNQMRELTVTAGMTQPHVLLEYGRAPGTLGGNNITLRWKTLGLGAECTDAALLKVAVQGKLQSKITPGRVSASSERKPFMS